MGKHIFETLSKAITKSLSLLGVVATAIIFVVQLLVYEVVKKSTGIDLSGGNNIPLVTIGILAISFLVVFIFYFFWELQAVFIRLNFKTKVEWDTQNDQVKKVYLMVDYQEPVELTDCFASLVGASQLYPSDNDNFIELNLIDHGILKWKNGNKSSDCKVELPPAPESKTEICVAILQGRLFFCYCNGSHRSGGIGLFLIRMRLDEKLKGNSIRPKFFNGYLMLTTCLGRLRLYKLQLKNFQRERLTNRLGI